MRVLGRCFTQALLLALPVASAAQAQQVAAPSMTQQAAAAALADGQLTSERDRALALALDLGARAGAELRGAVIDAAWAELRGETNRPEGSEAVFDYMHAVAQLGDPRAIPFLIEVLENGSNAANALADFGAKAFTPVLAVVSDPDGYPPQVREGMTALRFMLEDGVLTAGQTDRVRAVVQGRLSGTQHHSVVDAALRLALALGDPGLRAAVARIADNRAFAEVLVSPNLASGNPMRAESHAQFVNSVQKYARTFLDGGGADIGPFRRRLAVTVH